MSDGGEGYALITGGAGFVGSNLANRLAGEGWRVLLYDNLHRAHVADNVRWLKQRHGDRIAFEVADIRDADAVSQAVQGAARVYHFAAQVAVTTSLADPVADFDVNARGTLNVLEAIRARAEPPPLIFTSTNKVYGKLGDLALVDNATRYEPEDAGIRARGISETQPLELYSPYGCSKGAADQYVLDYARIYGLPTVVFRMSCIYGPRQFGTEDQGWVAHFLISAIEKEPITIYGDGKQVRDILFVDDLVEAFLLAGRHMENLRGRAFNIGGGPRNAVSLLEIVEQIRAQTNLPVGLYFAPPRPGDQLYYVSDTTAFEAATGWSAAVDAKTGLRRLTGWLHERFLESRGAQPESEAAPLASSAR